LVSTERLKLIEPENNQIPISHQCALLQINRSTVYRRLSSPETDLGMNPKDLAIMNQIDRIYVKRPFYGIKRMTWQLNQNGLVINHKRVARLMGVMGIQAVFPHPFTSKPNENHQTFPYLLKGLEIIKPNQVWGTDITYVKIHHSWCYLVAIIDWFSRYVVSWELSPNMEVGFCINTLTKALAVNTPIIHNSDQGSQFTSNEYLAILKNHPEIQISMDGRGRCMDNIFTERLWRSFKYEEVYLKDYQDYQQAKESIDEYFRFYNEERPHQSLQNQFPKHVYYQKNQIIYTIQNTKKGGEQSILN